MSADLFQALEAVAQRVTALAAEDPDLRAHLRALAQAILSATAEVPGAVPAQAGPREQQDTAMPGEVITAASPSSADTASLTRPESAVAPPEAVPAPAIPSPGAGPAAAPPLPAWDAEVRRGHPIPAPVGDADLPLIEDRCRLKAEGARWAVTRRRRLADRADYRTEIEPQDRAIIDRAKELPDCFLWMNHPSGPSPANLSLLEDVAGCFEAVADAVALIREALAEPEDNREVFEQALDLTAEAQSALRAAVARLDALPDKDQERVFAWLRATAGERQLFIRRFMRADDPADPGGWADLGARIDALGGRLEEARQRARRRRKLLGKLRYLVRRLAEDGEADRQERWLALAAGADELVRAGTPPSNREVRELLLPVLDDMPDLAGLPAGFELVLREIDRYLESRPPATGVVLPAEPTAEVKVAARLLGGKSLVLIGGGRRPDALEALKASLGLKELYWVETREHQSLEGFEPYVARPDVAVVLLAIRWSSHSFGDVREFCDRHGKPLVRLPAGYHPNQVAHQVVAQCSGRLAPAS